ncbi:DUF5684 domain-containing protein [Cohnella mopanensis]|uniref:DUF5684 domain-containing protein n=1 Tax=Cohnella mopanensis TaxID=2911966 RepID=UPI001EF95532|nr:DUF5684 domain-containing protein [Cohnella mopanensis]
MLFVVLFSIVLYFLVCGAYYSLAKKANLDGIAWFAFIPILSQILKLKMIKESGWMILLMVIPLVNFIFTIIWEVKLLNAFGKNGAHVLFFVFLSPVYLIQWLVWGYSSNTTYRLSNPINPNGPNAAY